MIAFLKGTLVSKSPTDVVLEVNGVGYQVSIPLSTFERLREPQESVTLLTYLHVREDILQLYGFLTEEEREFFRLLMTVSGIGPKMAQGILSGISTTELRTAITDGNIASLTTISGVGKKTAERIVIELRDKLSKAPVTSAQFLAPGKQPGIRSEAINALVSLGFQQSTAERAVLSVMNERRDEQLTVEEVIKYALRQAG